mmetsp:Transcript_13904/g.25116  ORF Transcript_13904/g.25116 Transcript_13904/m.25116 type:complete len:106 (-) Transcript_13904:171-488(-)
MFLLSLTMLMENWLKVSETNKKTLLLNLQVGAKLKMTDGPFKGEEGYVWMIKKEEKHILIVVYHDIKKKYRHRQRVPERTSRLFGRWMIEAAVNGKLSRLPFVNL